MTARDEKYHLKAEVRKRQMLEPTSPLMKQFVTSLIDTKDSEHKLILQCLKLSLDDLSRETISNIHQKYVTRRSQLPEGDTKSSEKYKREEYKLIGEASLGLEHLLREFGQIYESYEFAVTLKQSDIQYVKYYQSLPQIAAQLLVNGYPLELMDGDAAHVPTKWVQGVLCEAVRMLEDPKVYVMSVLGLQSTGKSTLLNTAFGLQFNVSAGRCTRGAFMQLLPLDERLRQEAKCDYVLVVDTEGLRATELDSNERQKT